MRCLACDKLLGQGEDARRYSSNPSERIGLCNNCAIFVDVPMVGGDDIVVEESAEDPSEPLVEDAIYSESED